MVSWRYNLYYLTCKVIGSLDCSHYTTVCLVSGVFHSQTFLHYITDPRQGGAHYKIPSLADVYDVWSPITRCN